MTRKEYSRRYYEKHKERLKAYGRQRHAAKTPEQKAREAERQREYRARQTPEVRAAWNARKRALRYGLEPAEVAGLEVHQLGRCEGCGDALGDKSVIDHCHATGRVRGLLCQGCNVAVGMSKDTPATLRALADYLERHSTTPAK